MPLVSSLLTAIVRADGDALVLHAGERPYVVTPTGQPELTTRVLTLEAMVGMLGELLPAEARKTLDEVGAVQHDLSRPPLFPNEHFTIVAARGGDDVWIEIRRHRVPAAAEAPAPVSETPEPAAPETADLKVGTTGDGSIGSADLKVGLAAEVEEQAPPDYVHEIAFEDAGSTEPAYVLSSTEQEPDYVLKSDEHEPFYEMTSAAADASSPGPINQPQPISEPERQQPVEAMSQPIEAGPASQSRARRAFAGGAREQEPEAAGHPNAGATLGAPAVVFPISRNQMRAEQTVRYTPPLNANGIDRLLRIAAAKGASTLYLSSQARPSIRVDGEISPIEGEPVLSEAEVEALMLDIIPERNRETLRSEAGTEWICDVPDVGRIRCVTFRDHRGPGGIFRMIPARAISAEQLGLSREIQGLCAEAEGLVLVTGPRASGKSTLIAAFVDLINRTRSDHVITLENQIKFVHENRGSLVSQREVRGDNNELMSVARAALRENPDVLVIEDFGSPEIVMLALEAAQSGHLIIGGLTAHTATDAVDRIIDQTPPERRAKIQLGLSENLRGIVAQVLLRRSGGGRVAAREVLLNTSSVASLIAEGKTSQLRTAIDSGRKHGMVPLNDALAAFVESGIVDSREAYRQAADRQGFIGLLKRQGIDTSFVERLA